MAKRVRLSEYRERKMAGAVEIETDDGQVFVVPPPELWPDVDRSLRGEEVAELVVGKDRWAAFLKAGGTFRLFDSIWAEREQLTLGEAPPSPPS